MFSKILVPVDMRHTNESQRAISAAVELSRQVGAKLYILTVWRPLGHHSLQEMPEDHKPEFEAFVSEQSREHGVEFTAVFEHADSASDRIREVAEDLGIDLVVMASHDPRFTDYLLGSNATHVALHTSCTVMIVR